MKLRNNKFLYKLSLNIKLLKIEEYPKTEKRHKKAAGFRCELLFLKQSDY